ncbi:Beta-galactosidase [Pontiella desulfatans]|uniref:Beta-galactosidase n=1 Tax=Pontiella desulfatans TaxID=2750659 RepID=A0A6C2UC81_PONDE|nr:glycoside hydrolase family 2 TIM barrel-domain containing protein [Pontiella desulfatans]VGO17788.1 Beta-galactosidase [Pontiella desulfatans]
MKKIWIVAALLVALGLAGCKEVSENTISVNADWKFQRLENPEADTAGFEAVVFDDSAWEIVSLPHSAYLEPLVITDQWQGVCWYRKDFDVDKELLGKKIILTLEGAMSQSQVWINGKLAKERAGGYLPVVVDASDFVKEGRNQLAIRLDSRDNPLTGPKPVKRLDFCMYSGLYRNVLITLKDELHISHPVLADKVAGGGVFVTFPKVSEDESVVKVKTHVVNGDDEAETAIVLHELFFDGKLVAKQSSAPVEIKAGGDAEFVQEIKVAGAQLWSPDAPNLYTLKTSVLEGDEVEDVVTCRIGIRAFEFRNGHELFLNGEKIFLRGTNRHQDYPYIGYALSDNAQWRDAKLIKDGGFNCIRLSHYPHSPAFMDACDELGLITIDAIMGWQYYNDDDRFREYCYRSARELIRRDRNHPCVLTWEVSLNETKMPEFFMDELHRITHAEYPGNNTFSCGWMDYAYDIFFQARQHRILHGFHPKLEKPYFVSEYGDWEYFSNNAGLNQDQLDKARRLETSSRQARGFGEKRLLQQCYNLQESHNDNLGTYAFGDGYWVWNDYNRGYAQDIEYSGVVDLFRIPKFAYYFYQSQRDPAQGAMVNVASWWTPESATDVKVHSNCEEVELLLNGNSVARQKPDSNKNTTKLGHPPFTFTVVTFTPGTLKAVGYIGGKPVAEHVVQTPGKAVALKVWLGENGKAPEAGVSDTVFAYIAAVDENGTVVPTFSDEVSLKLTGDVKLMNVDCIMAEAGIATALLQIGAEDGAINLSAEHGDMKGSLTFHAE